MLFQMKDPLNETQWESIDRAVFDILENTGIQIDHGEVIQALGSKKGVRIRGKRVRLERRLVQENIQGVKGCTEYDTPALVGAYCHNFIETDNLSVRPSTFNDLVTSLRQVEALGQAACAPVVPLDVPGPRQELLMERLTHENVRLSYGGGQATSALTAEAAIEMSAVVNRPRAIEMWVSSPLIMDPLGLDIIWKLRHRRPDVRVISSPVRGMTAPISLAGGLAQSAAECFAAASLLRILDIAGTVAFRTDAFVIYPVEMRGANVLVSGPEYLRHLVLSILLARRHGVDAPMGKALLTMSKLPDAQAASEKLAQGLTSKMVGAGTMTACGTLAGVETYSPVQMVIDLEIIRWIEAFMKPLDFSEDDFLLDVVDQVGPGGTFLDQDTTLSRFRDVSWKPDLFTYEAVGAWMAQGQPKLLDKARDTLESLALSDAPVISRQQQQELARIEEKFAARL